MTETIASDDDLHDEADLADWLDAKALADEREGATGLRLVPSPSPDTADGPTADEPMRGLRRLSSIAMFGAARIRELASQPIAYVWKDYAAEGTIAALAGPSSGGKTTLLFLLMLARAHRGAPIDVAGRAVTPAPPGRVIVLIEGEHGEGSAARKLLKSAALLGLDDAATDAAIGRVITFARKAVTVGSPAWAEIKRMVAAGIVSDVAIDTIARVAPGNANDEAEQAAIFEKIAQAIEKGPEGAQPVVWLVAHTRKMGGKDMTLEDVSGSSQRVAQSDFVIGVTSDRDENDHVVSSRVRLLKDREDSDNPPVPMTLEIARDPLRLVWSAAVPKAKGAKGVDAELLAKVRGYIVEQGCVPPGDVAADALGVRKASYFLAVRAIVAEQGKPGPLVQERPKQGKKFKGWELVS